MSALMRINVLRELEAHIKSREIEFKNKIANGLANKAEVLRLSGALEEIEYFQTVTASILNQEFEKSTRREAPITFAYLVETLSALPDDAPIKFIVMADIASEKPLSNVRLTMAELRRLNGILNAFSELLRTNGP